MELIEILGHFEAWFQEQLSHLGFSEFKAIFFVSSSLSETMSGICEEDGESCLCS